MEFNTEEPLISFLWGEFDGWASCERHGNRKDWRPYDRYLADCADFNDHLFITSVWGSQRSIHRGAEVRVKEFTVS